MKQKNPHAGTDRGSKRRRSGTEPASTSAPSETTTKTAGQTTDTDVSERPATRGGVFYEHGVPKMNKQKRGPTSSKICFKNLRDYLLADHHGIRLVPAIHGILPTLA
ncbi:hypothetical protein Tco_1154098 [Tanacetum coccineum]